MSRRTAWLSDNPLPSPGDGLPVSREDSRPLQREGNARQPQGQQLRVPGRAKPSKVSTVIWVRAGEHVEVGGPG